MLECVVNVSEGRSLTVLGDLDAAAGRCLLDRHSDADHNRSVFTLAGPDEVVEESVRSLARAVVAGLDLARHSGVHPRIGTLDVVPFVALDPIGSGNRPAQAIDRPGQAVGGPAQAIGGPAQAIGGPAQAVGGPGQAVGGPARLVEGPLGRAVAARDRFASWAGAELELPCFLYGPVSGALRSLPEVRRRAWRQLRPDTGPDRPHPRAGAAALGARGVLVAYNLWLTADPGFAADLTDVARRVAAAVRRPALRTLGLAVAGGAQVSCNLVAPWVLGPGEAYDLVEASLPPGVRIGSAELVGLLPAAILVAEPARRHAQLGIASAQTIEARLDQAGLDGGSRGR